MGNHCPVILTRYRVYADGVPLEDYPGPLPVITFDEYEGGAWVRYEDAVIAELRMKNSDRVRAEHKKQIAAIEKHRQELSEEYRAQIEELRKELQRFRDRESEIAIKECELRICKRVHAQMKTHDAVFVQAARKAFAYVNTLTPKRIDENTPDGVYVWVANGDHDPDGEWTKACRGATGRWRGLGYFDPQPEWYLERLPGPPVAGSTSEP